MDHHHLHQDLQNTPSYPDPSIPPHSDAYYGSALLAHDSQSFDVHHQLGLPPQVPAYNEDVAPAAATVDAGNAQVARSSKSTARNKPKASKACDNCAHKKQGCVQLEGKEGPCERCKHHKLICTYNKVTHKRGPNKGYIKSLEGRIECLEQEKRAASSDLGAVTPGKRERTDDPDGDVQGRGAFSLAEGDHFYGSGYPPQNISRDEGMSSDAQFSPSLYETQEISTGARWLPAPESTRPSIEHDPVMASLEYQWSDVMVEEYYKRIHNCFPLLDATPQGIKSRLSNAQPQVVVVFHASLRSLNTAYMSTLLTDSASSIRECNQIITNINFLIWNQATVLNAADSIVLLQSMALMSLQAEANHEPISRLGSMLANGVQLAHKLRLFEYDVTVQSDEANQDARQSRRLWLSLVGMDRWQASSRSHPTLIPEEAVVLYPTDSNLMGVEAYELLRLTMVVNHYIVDLLAPGELSSCKLITSLLKGELKRCVESWPWSVYHASASKHPNLNLGYWIIRLLTDLRYPEVPVQELVHSASHVARIMRPNVPVFGPLHSRACALAMLVLLELRKDSRVEREAYANITKLLEVIAPNRHFHRSWDRAIVEYYDVAVKGNSNGNSNDDSNGEPRGGHLQQLAEAAMSTGASPNRGPASSAHIAPPTPRFPDLMKIIRKGYLSAFDSRPLH